MHCLSRALTADGAGSPCTGSSHDCVMLAGVVNTARPGPVSLPILAGSVGSWFDAANQGYHWVYEAFDPDVSAAISNDQFQAFKAFTGNLLNQGRCHDIECIDAVV